MSLKMWEFNRIFSVAINFMIDKVADFRYVDIRDMFLKKSYSKSREKRNLKSKNKFASTTLKFEYQIKKIRNVLFFTKM